MANRNNSASIDLSALNADQIAALVAALGQGKVDEELMGISEKGTLEIRLSISTNNKALTAKTLCNVTGGRVVEGPSGYFLSFMPRALKYDKEKQLVRTSEGFDTYLCWNRLVTVEEGARKEYEINLDKFLDAWLGAFPHRVLNADIPSDVVAELRRIVSDKVDASLVLRFDTKVWAGKEPEPLEVRDEFGSLEPVFIDGKPVMKKTFNVSLSHVSIIEGKTSSEEDTAKMIDPNRFILAVEEAIKESALPKQYFPQWKLDREVAQCNEYLLALRAKLDVGRAKDIAPSKMLGKLGIRDDLFGLVTKYIAGDDSALVEFEAQSQALLESCKDTGMEAELKVSIENALKAAQHRLDKHLVGTTATPVAEVVPTKEVVFEEVPNLDDADVFAGLSID